MDEINHRPVTGAFAPEMERQLSLVSVATPSGRATMRVMTSPAWRAARIARFEGAQRAEIVFANCRGLPREAIEAAQALRAKIAIGRMADKAEAGGSPGDCEAYYLAADTRFYERIDELTLAAVNGAPRSATHAMSGKIATGRAMEAKDRRRH